ncbi:MAG TPA: hypothetical protein DCW41_05075 [Clostridiales bacterium]|nr:hypothetical protein [Clostridiales bacterium]
MLYNHLVKRRSADKTVICILTVFPILAEASGNIGGTVVACVLMAFIATFITEISRSDIFSSVVCAGLSVVSFFFPSLALCIPGTFYSLTGTERKLPVKISVALSAAAGITGVISIVVSDVSAVLKIQSLLICGLSLYLSLMTSSREKTEKEMKGRFDEARRSAIDAGRLSEEIMKNSDNEIYLARLKERNRIAREIHDNVGHMITRVIVQLQAIKIINRDEDVAKQLDSVGETLDLAMTGIRKSVHELHDDSIDLSIGLHDTVSVLKDRFDTDVRTSIDSPSDNAFKTNILAIVKEGVTNISKYSTGNKVLIELVENVTFWRLKIWDNGKNKEREYYIGENDVSGLTGDGIGLQNIGARAKAMGGRAMVRSDGNGFMVLVTIQKEKNQ